MPRIYTKTGDDGTTGLLYGGRVPKDDPATDAYGTTDEAVAVAGPGPVALRRPDAAARTCWSSSASCSWWAPTSPRTRAKREEAARGRLARDRRHGRAARGDGSTTLVAERPLPEVFIVPGANPASAALDVARSVIRRAERQVVALERRPNRTVNPEVRRYLNRLSRPALRAGAVAGRRERAREPR